MDSFSQFKLQYFTYKQCPKEWVLPAHICLEHGLVIVLSGSADYKINGKHYSVHEGEIIFNEPGFSRQAHSKYGLEIAAIDFVLPNTKFHYPVLSTVQLNGEFIDLIRHFQYAWLQRTLGWEMLCKGLFLQIIHHILYASEIKINHHVEKIKRYLIDNLSNKIDISALACEMNLNPVYCGALFKKIEGISIAQYVNQMRIQKATELLREGTSTVSEVAELCGFNDAYYFSRVFKQIMHTSPTKYR